MYPQATLPVIQAVADGIDPLTGEVLPVQPAGRHPRAVRGRPGVRTGRGLRGLERVSRGLAVVLIRQTVLFTRGRIS